VSKCPVFISPERGERMATKSTKSKLIMRITSLTLHLLINMAFYVLVIVLIVNVSKKAYAFSYQLYGQVAEDKKPGRENIFQIKKGEATMDIASKLKLNKLIVDKYSFYFKAKLKNYTIMPGTYILNSSMTYDDIFDIITDYSASIVQEDGVKVDDPEGDQSEDPIDEQTEDPVDEQVEE